MQTQCLGPACRVETSKIQRLSVSPDATTLNFKPYKSNIQPRHLSASRGVGTKSAALKLPTTTRKDKRYANKNTNSSNSKSMRNNTHHRMRELSTPRASANQSIYGTLLDVGNILELRGVDPSRHPLFVCTAQQRNCASTTTV